jgi:phospholipase/carboxylesterase
VLAFSGFMPVVEGWEPSFEDRLGTRAFVSHGNRDPVIEIEFAHSAVELLESGGLEVEYHESELGHQIDPAHLRDAADWLATTLRP